MFHANFVPGGALPCNVQSSLPKNTWHDCRCKFWRGITNPSYITSALKFLIIIVFFTIIIFAFFGILFFFWSQFVSDDVLVKLNWILLFYLFIGWDVSSALLAWDARTHDQNTGCWCIIWSGNGLWYHILQGMTYC